MKLPNPVFNYTSETNSCFNTIHYNPYKPNILAVGCADRSIQLLSTAHKKLSNLYLTMNYAENDSLSPPTCIETEFEIKDISWNPHNPGSSSPAFLVDVLAACGMSDSNPIGIWDIRRPFRLCLVVSHSTLPYKMLHQTQRVKEICWMTHPGSNSSEEYLAVLQDASSQSTIDIFLTRSLPLFSSTICSTSLSVNRWCEVACVLNGAIRDQPHIPESLPENTLVSCAHQSIHLIHC